MARSFTAEVPVWKDIAVPVQSWRQTVLAMIGAGFHALSESRPRLYLLLAAAAALAGYLWLLLFPWLVLASVRGIHAALGSGPAVAWNQACAWLVTGACATLVSYRLYRFRPALPAGNALDHATHPALFGLVADLSGHFRGVRIDRIMLSSDFGVEILKTPRYALPVQFTNTLVIGEPLLQVLSQTQFRCVLASRLGQFSMRYNRLENWLYQLRGIWPQYEDRGRTQGAGYQPVAWFFRLYAPVYRAITAPAACLDELAADRYALELCDDETVLDTITTLMVCRQYLREKYWPVVRRYAARNSRVLEKLHAGMVSVLRAGLQPDAVNRWLVKTLDAEDRCGDPVPSLVRRIDNIGFSSTRMDALAAEAAAGVYLASLKLK